MVDVNADALRPHGHEQLRHSPVELVRNVEPSDIVCGDLATLLVSERGSGYEWEVSERDYLLVETVELQAIFQSKQTEQVVVWKDVASREGGKR